MLQYFLIFVWENYQLAMRKAGGWLAQDDFLYWNYGGQKMLFVFHKCYVM